MIQLAIFLSIAVVLSMGLLHFSNMFWTIYTSTPMGQQFIEMYSGISLAVSDLLKVDLLSFSIKVTLTAFVFCLLTSAALQLVYVVRYLYLPRKLPGRLILFGIPLTAAVAGHIQTTCGLDHWNIALAVASFPTLFLFSHCFKFANEFIPETGDLITDMAEIIKKVLNFMRNESNLKQ